MTRISGAQRGVNPLVDQIGSLTSARDASANNANNGAFDSHLAQLSSHSSGSPLQEDTDTGAPTEKGASSQKAPVDSVSALFAAITGDDQDQAAITEAVSPSATAAGLTAMPQSTAPATSTSQTATSLATTSQIATPQATTSQLSSMLESFTGKHVISATESSQSASSDDGSPAAEPSHSAERPKLNATKTATGATSGSQGASDTADSTVPSPLPDLSNIQVSDATAAAQMAAAALASSSAAPVSQPSAQIAATSASVSNTVTPQVTASDISSIGALGGSNEDGASPVAKTSSDFRADVVSSEGSSSQTIKMNVSSLQSQKHFAPVQQLSPTQQIADFAVSTAGSMTTTSSSDTQAAASSQTGMTAASITPTSGSPLQTLTLALEPDALGTVTVKMRLVDSGLEVQVEAEKSETASLIEKDKGSLSDRLQSAGYSVDSLVVSTAAAQGSHLDQQNDQTSSGQAQQGANDAPASGSSQNGGRNANDQSPAQNGRESTGGFSGQTEMDAASVRSAGDDIYV